MPELPEVETTRRGIEPLIAGKTIHDLQVHNSSLRWPVSEDLETTLPGQRVLSVGRRSKYLLIALDKGTLILHLGMTGHLRYDNLDALRRKHDHVEFVFTDDTVLRYNDSRRFGSILWTTADPLQHKRLAHLGPEPLDESFNADGLYSLSRHRKVAIKPFIMNARVVVGVGNIYASEALFRAGISPKRPAGRVSKAAFVKLTASIKDVLAEAIEAGGTTIRDFANSDGMPGYFKQELQVYGRDGAPCTRCGALIIQVKLGQRSTYYCSVCQK